ncbi:MAG TPA: hypothetical protein DCP68_02765 [Ruminococcus sp.]|nr:hypothetical protein [Ruminococcus sp.]
MTAIRKIRESIGISQAEAARRIGLSRQAYSNYELGKRQADYETLLKMAETFSVSVDELLGGGPQNDPPNVAAVFDDSFRMIPVFESVSAGFGTYADSHIVDYMPLRIVSDSEAAETIAIRVTGDSMSPKIEDGDIIQCRKQDTVDSGSIAVVLLDDDEGLVKRVVYGPEWIELQSINPYYPPRRFEGSEMMRIRVVGLVKGVFHAF